MLSELVAVEGKLLIPTYLFVSSFSRCKCFLGGAVRL